MALSVSFEVTGADKSLSALRANFLGLASFGENGRDRGGTVEVVGIEVHARSLWCSSHCLGGRENAFLSGGGSSSVEFSGTVIDVGNINGVEMTFFKGDSVLALILRTVDRSREISLEVGCDVLVKKPSTREDDIAVLVEANVSRSQA